jgi:uncharacterized protein YndB with AHSA1/START domain
MSDHTVFTMPHQITDEIEIDRPVEEVFSYVTAPENQVHWEQGVLEIRDVSGPPGVGQQYTAVARFLGKRFQTTEEITDFESNKAYGWRTTHGPIHDVHLFRFEPHNVGTKITVDLGVRYLNFFERLAEPLIRRSAHRHQEHSLQTLKDLLETHGPDHPR